MLDLNNLNIKIFLDTANLDKIKDSLNKFSFIKGFTTNPSLMHKEGVTNYEEYCKEALKVSSNLPISFEVFSDDLKDMEDEARIIKKKKKTSIQSVNTNTGIESPATISTNFHKLVEKITKKNIFRPYPDINDIRD